MTFSFSKLVASRPSWQTYAACVDADTNLFYPENPKNQHDYAAAKEFCDRCVVQQECLDYAIKNEELYGVWGGKTPNERDVIR